MKKIILFPVMLIIMLYVIGSGIVPKYKNIAVMQDEISEQKETLANLKKDTAHLVEVKEGILARNTDQTFVNNFVPDDAVEQSIINAASRYAQNRGVNLITIGFDHKTKAVRHKAQNDDESMAELQYADGNVIVEGSYDQVMEYMYDLFRIKRLYQFSSITIDKAEKKNAGTENKDETGQADKLSLEARFKYAYLPTVPKLSIADLKNDLSYDAITQLQSVIENIPEITETTGERVNPFLP